MKKKEHIPPLFQILAYNSSGQNGHHDKQTIV